MIVRRMMTMVRAKTSNNTTDNYKNYVYCDKKIIEAIFSFIFITSKGTFYRLQIDRWSRHCMASALCSGS
jgi:hypothetical protein